MYYKGQLVTRNSYNNDIVFKIKEINENKVILKGYNIRLLADCYVDDLRKCEEIRNNEDDIDLPIPNQNYINGKVLHLDSDVEYLKRSMKLYEKYQVPCVGYRIDKRT